MWIFWGWLISVPILAGVNWGLWLKKTVNFKCKNIVTGEAFYKSIGIVIILGGVVIFATFLYIEFFQFCVSLFKEDKTQKN